MYFRRIALPAQSKTLVNYMQFLTIKMKALGTIRSYVAGVKTLHELLDLDVAAFNSIRVKLMWMGLENTITHVTKRAIPISPEILCNIKSTLDMSRTNDVAFWALCITAFNILARKSNLVPVSTFDPQRQLSRGNLVFGDNYVDVHVHWTKTRRAHEDPLVYPLYRIPRSRVCPFEALKAMFKRIPANADAPCFMWEDGTPIKYRQFLAKLRGALKDAGYQEYKRFGTHSFRAGGASWAARSGVPSEMIRLLGSWQSDAYLKYVEYPREARQEAGAMMRRKIMQLGF